MRILTRTWRAQTDNGGLDLMVEIIGLNEGSFIIKYQYKTRSVDSNHYTGSLH